MSSPRNPMDDRYGKLSLVSYGAGKWTCRCDCGKVVQVAANNLRDGRQRSCGCLRLERVGPGGWNKKPLEAKYGMLTVQERIGASARCLCDCGNTTLAKIGNLRSGNTKSCGCLHALGSRPKHGMTRTITYKSWADMRRRCSNPNYAGYADYGGRGIAVCDRWREFSNFLADMGERPGKGYTLDRWPNNDGNYEPGNCRWATAKEQANNRRPRRYYRAPAPVANTEPGQ